MHKKIDLVKTAEPNPMQRNTTSKIAVVLDKIWTTDTYVKAIWTKQQNATVRLVPTMVRSNCSI